ncbi:Mitochondrial ribosomal protein S18A, partial [Halocaridina rubra]
MLIKTDCEDSQACPLCTLNLDIKHTDVLILSQFLRKDGCLLPRRITGLCNKQQLRLKYLVAMSQKA